MIYDERKKRLMKKGRKTYELKLFTADDKNEEDETWCIF